MASDPEHTVSSVKFLNLSLENEPQFLTTELLESGRPLYCRLLAYFGADRKRWEIERRKYVPLVERYCDESSYFGGAFDSGAPTYSIGLE